jgi:hypothetical protein
MHDWTSVFHVDMHTQKMKGYKFFDDSCKGKSLPLISGCFPSGKDQEPILSELI